MNEKKFTLYKLLTPDQEAGANRIVIPIIQRDYAQGRLDEHATYVRKRFVKTLDRAVRNNEDLCLDFVYLQRDKDAWIPVDGQQRLTTLFLFYLYHLRKDKVGYEEYIKALGGFSYEVRQSTKAFCAALVGNREDWAEKKDSPSTIIKNEAWFFSAWELDPSIKGMLETLDTIHDVSSSPLEDNSWVVSDSIYFFGHVVRASEDMYRKLNDRGKPLSVFENFKAYLEMRMQEEHVDADGEWAQNVDTSWLEEVWDNKAEDAVDAAEMALLRLSLSMLLLNYVVEDKERNAEEMLKLLDPIEKAIVNETPLPMDSIETIVTKQGLEFLCKDFGKVFTEGGLKASQWMTPFVTLEDTKQDWLLDALRGADTAVGSFKNVTEFRKVALKLFAFFLDLDSSHKKWEMARDWRTIAHNIIENDSRTFVNLIRRLDTIHRDGRIQSESSEQEREEIKKCERVNKDKKWASLFVTAEQRPWLRGRVALLLKNAETFEAFDFNLTRLYNTFEAKEEDVTVQEKRFKWLCKAITVIENEYNRNPFPVHIPCRLTHYDDLLKEALYPPRSTYDENRQGEILYFISDNVAPSNSEWLQNLNASTKIEVNGAENAGWCTWENRNLLIMTYNSRVYLKVNKTQITSARCIDRTVSWWYLLEEVTSDWITANSGSWIEVLNTNYPGLKFAFNVGGTIQIWVIDEKGEDRNGAEHGDWRPNDEQDKRQGERIGSDMPSAEEIREIMDKLAKTKWTLRG